MALIYCLKDPVDLLIKYVGKTWVSLSERLRLHLIDAKRSKRLNRKQKWLLDLLAQNHKPIIEILEVTDRANWRAAEINWISKGKAQGWPLLNLKRGGEGYDNLTHSPEFKKKVSDRMKGNSYGKGVKWTDSQRALMKLRSTWNKGKRGLIKYTDDRRKKVSIRMTGEKHHQSKLTDEQTLELRERYNAGENRMQLAAEYGICYSHCVKISTNKIRKSCVH